MHHERINRCQLCMRSSPLRARACTLKGRWRHECKRHRRCSRRRRALERLLPRPRSTAVKVTARLGCLRLLPMYSSLSLPKRSLLSGSLSSSPSSSLTLVASGLLARQAAHFAPLAPRCSATPLHPVGHGHVHGRRRLLHGRKLESRGVAVGGGSGVARKMNKLIYQKPRDLPLFSSCNLLYSSL